MNKPRIGVFGSAFDPPTLGHQDVLQQAASSFDKILLVPSASHAFNKKSLSLPVRIELLKRFAREAEVDCELEVSDLEADMLKENPDQPVYTFDLLERLEQVYNNEAEFGFIRGPDNADPNVWRRFYKSFEIEQRWLIFTARERLQIRSSKVRSILESPELADDKNLDRFLLPSVRAYIQQHKLYQF